MKMSRSLCLSVAVALLMATSSSGDNDAKPHPDLPEFQEGVTVRVLDRLESCLEVAVSGKWLEVQFVAKQMSDDGENYEEFDSTYSRNRPLLIAVDDKEKFPGLVEGLRDVCVGEKREITIQADSPLMEINPKSGLIKPPNPEKPAVYEVTVNSIQHQEPVNIFAKMDLDDNNQLSREELKRYFIDHGLEGMTEDDADMVIDGLMQSNDLDTNDHLSHAEFPHPYDHNEL